MPGRRGTAGHWVGLIGIAVVAFASIGLLGWIAPLVAGVRTRRRWDWVVLTLSVVFLVLAFVCLIVGSETEDEKAAREAVGGPAPQSVLDDVGAVMLLVLMVAVPVWWCVRSARWARAMRGQLPPREAGYAPWAGVGLSPQSLSQPLPRPVVPGYPHPGPAVRPHFAPSVPSAPPPVAPPAAGPPPAVDDPAARARARLQGLSERLREQDGGNPGGPR
ncbi:hypothetical protein B4N89_23025 [Embleya scabrispora]|uniref:Uncharacterized protein n=1 Tax=Embleya scabrispora TaxID=159449 RepID=A0A1T3P3B7_9ACTN|nr:hypothetical protein B4N89_23025 [Embleya scabrispora]